MWNDDTEPPNTILLVLSSVVVDKYEVLVGRCTLVSATPRRVVRTTAHYVLNVLGFDVNRQGAYHRATRRLTGGPEHEGAGGVTSHVELVK